MIETRVEGSPASIDSAAAWLRDSLRRRVDEAGEKVLSARVELDSGVVLETIRGALRGLARRAVIAALAMGAVGYATQAGLFFLALERMDASLLALVLYTYPAFVLVGAVLLGETGDAPWYLRLIREASDHHGAQCVMLSIDAKRRPDGSGWNVFVGGGRADTGLDLLHWAEEGQRLGAGEICLNVMDADGTRAGFDLAATRAVADFSRIEG